MELAFNMMVEPGVPAEVDLAYEGREADARAIPWLRSAAVSTRFQGVSRYNGVYLFPR